MANLSHIDMTQVDIGPDGGSGYDLIPEGKYLAKVIESKLVPTKGTYQPDNNSKPVPNGHLLELTWQILSGPHERRLIWDKLTLIHKNAEAQKIGRETWAKALRAARVENTPQDSKEIHDKLVTIYVKTAPASNVYDARNVVKGYYPPPAQADMSGVGPMPGEPQVGHQAQTSAPPWNPSTKPPF